MKHTHVTCQNCHTEVPEDTITIVEKHKPSGVEEMSVCAYCAKPVEIEVLFRPAMDAHWILYYDGFGVNRKEVEVFGDSRQEAVSRFREAWIKVFDRELVNLIVK